MHDTDTRWARAGTVHQGPRSPHPGDCLYTRHGDHRQAAAISDSSGRSRSLADDRESVPLGGDRCQYCCQSLTDGSGALRLTTTGRRTRLPRQVVIGYVEDGRNLITMAMNGWGAAEPAWWLNLQAHPDATAQTRDGARQVRARRAQGDERERLWSRWAEIDKNLDAYAALRPAETAVVVFEPQDTADPAAEPGPGAHAAASSEGGAP